MKCISIMQPWAQAIFLGYKSIETRSWAASYRGPLLIHASKTVTKFSEEFAAVELGFGRGLARVPRGCILGVVDLESIGDTEDQDYFISALERRYGNFTYGRKGWQLKEPRAFKEPIAYSGRQGLFEVPDSVIAKALKEIAQ